ncbi:anti-sigma factor [Pontiella sp.]|uniref:anti-sigma factor family protein n=1 Tax=Pontiella sp. TaxID=2837462 RepID=UPI00356A5921
MTRYEELLSLYLDGEPTEAELNELADLLKADAALAENFRSELLIWDAWSQAQAPERSGEAFLAGLHTRLRAEQDAPEFERSVTDRLRERKRPVLLRPMLAMAAVLAVLLSFGLFFNPADVNTGLVSSAEAAHVTIRGECVCLRCTLHNAERCFKAVRYTDELGEEHLIRLVRDPGLIQYNKCFCKGPTRVLIEGEIVVENGERMLLATSLTIKTEEAQ